MISIFEWHKIFMFSRKISCKAKLGKEIHGIGKGFK